VVDGVGAAPRTRVVVIINVLLGLLGLQRSLVHAGSGGRAIGHEARGSWVVADPRLHTLKEGWSVNGQLRDSAPHTRGERDDSGHLLELHAKDPKSGCAARAIQGRHEADLREVLRAALARGRPVLAVQRRGHRFQGSRVGDVEAGHRLEELCSVEVEQ
jgi:hypothetical protein